MKAVRFNASIPRYLAGKALGPIMPSTYWSGISCTYAEELAPPALPAPDWVRVSTVYGGICGTDMGTITLHTSPYYSPFSSSPFTIGHENVGLISEIGPAVDPEWQIGERVTVDPLLWCLPRGFDDMCEYCARGEFNRCQRITEGTVAPGVMTGTCRDTGGSWSRDFVAHQSQLNRVPDSVSDENALMAEPFAIGLHAALAGNAADNETVLIVGAGTIGLTTLAGLRALGSQARILVLARYPVQAAAAEQLGASEVFTGMNGDPFKWVAEQTGGTIRKPIIGKRVLSGGADLTFECAGNDSALDDALRFTKDGGRLVLSGMPGIARGIDWTAIFAQELKIIAARNYNNCAKWNNRIWNTFELGLHLMEHEGVDLGWMVTHRYAIEDYRQALRDAAGRGSSGMLKGVFDFRSAAGQGPNP